MSCSSRRLATFQVVSPLALLLASQLGAQQPQPQVPRAALSTRATAEVTLNGRMVGGQWLTGVTGSAGPAKIAIDYGQPHARGRAIMGQVVPWDSVWRTGANLATTLTTDVDLTIGTAFVPRGEYTLFTLPTQRGWKLVINKQTREWGTDYEPSQDLARVDLASRTLAEPLESLTIWLVPAQVANNSTDLPRGVLKIAWERTELSVNWRMGR